MVKGQIALSRTLTIKLSIPSVPFVNVRAGNKQITAKLAVNSSNKNSYVLSPDLMRYLQLNNNHRLQVRYLKDLNLLHIGPIIGIFTSSLPNYEGCDPRSVQADLIYLCQLGQKLHAQIFVFTPGSINWTDKTTRGYVYRKISPTSGEWVSAIYPLPDVVYDRIPSRAWESRSSVKISKNRLLSLPDLHYFNESFLDKWDVHQLLFTNRELHPFLPVTELLSKGNLEKMIQKYNVLYLKPCNGSLGRNIIKVMLNESGKLQFVVYSRTIVQGTANNCPELLQKTKKHRKGKRYIIQQGIDLATYKESPFDIRIIYQKGGKGNWMVSKKFVRVAPAGSSIANLSSGGRAERAVEVFKDIYNNRDLILSKNNLINSLCKTVALTLENTSKSIYGELGLDIGIDKDGSPWLIEVNSRPRKSTQTGFSQIVVRNTFIRPLLYAIYLAGFTKS